jgi:hypothetical protein
LGVLERDDVETARRMSPEERAAALVRVVRAGISLKLAALRERHPAASDVEIEDHLRRWLSRDDGV